MGSSTLVFGFLSPLDCFSGATFTATFTNGTALPSFIKFDATSTNFYVFTNDKYDKGIYDIKIWGNYLSTSYSTSTFDLTVKYPNSHAP